MKAIQNAHITWATILPASDLRRAPRPRVAEKCPSVTEHTKGPQLFFLGQDTMHDHLLSSVGVDMLWIKCFLVFSLLGLEHSVFHHDAMHVIAHIGNAARLMMLDKFKISNGCSGICFLQIFLLLLFT